MRLKQTDLLFIVGWPAATFLIATLVATIRYVRDRKVAGYEAIGKLVQIDTEIKSLHSADEVPNWLIVSRCSYEFRRNRRSHRTICHVVNSDISFNSPPTESEIAHERQRIERHPVYGAETRIWYRPSSPANAEPLGDQMTYKRAAVDFRRRIVQWAVGSVFIAIAIFLDVISDQIGL